MNHQLARTQVPIIRAPHYINKLLMQKIAAIIIIKITGWAPNKCTIKKIKVMMEVHQLTNYKIRWSMQRSNNNNYNNNNNNNKPY
jgi:hypothetical protein